MPMCAKFLGYHILIDGTKIDTANIVENWTDVITIEYTSKQAHIVQIELQKVFLECLTQREMRIGDGINGQGNNFWQSKTTLFNKI